MRNNYIVVGKIVAPHGVRGDVRIVPLTDDPQRFKLLQEVILDDGTALPIQSVRMHNQFVIIKFQGIDDRDAVDVLRGQMMKIPRELAMPLGEDEYYTSDIYGLNVFTTDGEDLGRIVNIIETGSNDVYVAQKGKKQTMIPALKRVVHLIDLEEQKMVVTIEEELEVR